MPALMRLPTHCWGFSTNLSTWVEPDDVTTTPYFDGSSTLVTRMVPSQPWSKWNLRSFSNGKGQITSEFSTKKGESSLPNTSLASAIGPPEEGEKKRKYERIFKQIFWNFRYWICGRLSVPQPLPHFPPKLLYPSIYLCPEALSPTKTSPWC